MRDQVFDILNKIYGSYYGTDSVRRMSKLMADRFAMGDLSDVDHLRNYIWGWYAGGDTAQLAAEKIAAAFPDYVRSEDAS